MSKIAHNRVKMEGKTYNSWKIISYSHTKNRVVYYNCKCLECEANHVVHGANIRTGRSKRCISCGLKKTANSNYGVSRSPYKTAKEAAERKFYGTYRRNAIYRKKEFNITLEEFVKLIYKNCEYCGRAPYKKREILKNSAVSKKRQLEGTLICNGVDREENEKGYTKENCVSCCSECNYAKGSFKNKKEFKDWVGKVYTHLYKQQRVSSPD